MIRIRITTSGDTPAVQTELAGRGLARAVTVAVGAAAEGAKLELRQQLGSRGGRLKRLANAIRSQAYPKPPRYSSKAAGIVYASGDGADRMFTAFSAGPIITPTKKKALAIPIHNYRGADRRLLGPRSSFFASRLVFIPRRRGARGSYVGIYAMAGSSRKGTLRKQRNTPRRKGLSKQLEEHLVPVFILVRAAKAPKLLSPEQVMAKWAGRVPDLIEQAARILA